jgi:hypothetical protein
MPVKPRQTNGGLEKKKRLPTKLNWEASQKVLTGDVIGDSSSHHQPLSFAHLKIHWIVLAA